MSINIDKVTALTEQLSQGTKQLARGSEGARLRLVQLAQELAQVLQTPRETFLRLWMLDSITRAVLQVASDLKLPEYLPDEHIKAVGSAELADKTGAEQALLTRLLIHLAATGFIEEAGPDLFYANALTRHLATESVQDGAKFYTRGMGKATIILPQYLAEHGYREPTDGRNCPWQMAFDTKLHSFEYIQQDPELAKLFKNSVLTQPQGHRAQWEKDPEFYPVQERLLKGFQPNAVLMVDVGGGMGLDCDLPARIEKMPHDFFQEQPPYCKGARAYFFHRIFHDWSDEKCREILLALKPAMIPGYTKILLQERVVPSQGATWLSTAADLVVMCGLAGKERTEKGFRDLVESVGMKVNGIYTRTPGEESIIEIIISE